MLSGIKGFYFKGGKRRPVTLKKGFDEFEFKVGDEILPDRIPVGRQNPKKWNLQKLVAIDLTPRTLPEFDKQVLNSSR